MFVSRKNISWKLRNYFSCLLHEREREREREDELNFNFLQGETYPNIVYYKAESVDKSILFQLSLRLEC